MTGGQALDFQQKGVEEGFGGLVGGGRGVQEEEEEQQD